MTLPVNSPTRFVSPCFLQTLLPFCMFRIKTSFTLNASKKTPSIYIRVPKFNHLKLSYRILTLDLQLEYKFLHITYYKSGFTFCKIEDPREIPLTSLNFFFFWILGMLAWFCRKFTLVLFLKGDIHFYSLSLDSNENIQKYYLLS